MKQTPKSYVMESTSPGMLSCRLQELLSIRIEFSQYYWCTISSTRRPVGYPRNAENKFFSITTNAEICVPHDFRQDVVALLAQYGVHCGTGGKLHENHVGECAKHYAFGVEMFGLDFIEMVRFSRVKSYLYDNRHLIELSSTRDFSASDKALVKKLFPKEKYVCFGLDYYPFIINNLTPFIINNLTEEEAILLKMKGEIARIIDLGIPPPS